MKANLLVLIFLVALVLLGFHFAADRKIVFAHYIDPKRGEFIVAGESNNLLEGWSVRLCWRVDQGLWFQYYLDHESSKWRAVDFRMISNILHIFNGKDEKCRLNMDTGVLFLEKTAQKYDHPVFIVIHENPFERQHRLYPDNSAWSNYWEAGLRNQGRWGR